MKDHNIKTITVHELKKRLDNAPDLCILDVREDSEWQEQHIPGALHLPKDEVTANIVAHIPDHDHPIYIHCRGGVRSLQAASYLLDLGYKEVYSIDGGIMEWAASGYPTKKGETL